MGMNILYVSSKKGWGGVVSWMHRTALGLEARGHKVWIVSHPDSRFTVSAPPGVRIIPKRLGMDYNPVMILFMARLIKKSHIDLVVTNIQKEITVGGCAARLTGIPSIRRIGNAVQPKVNTAGAHRAELERALGEPHPPDVDPCGVQMRGHPGAANGHVLEVDSWREQPPVEIADLELGTVSVGGPFDPAHRESARGFRIEGQFQQQCEEQNEGESRQDGDHRSSEVAVPHPPRSPHFSFRWRTWK